MPTDPLARFAAKVSINPDGCWDWTAAKHSKGYGQFRYGDSMRQAHRWLWERVVGPIPEGLEIDHLCRNRGCVNVDHMEPVTHAENVARTTGRKRPATSAYWKKWQDDRPDCPQGHPFTEENTMKKGNGRMCRTCNTEKARAWRAARASKFAD